MIVTEFQLERFLGGNPLRALDLGNALNVALVRTAAGRAQLLNAIPSALFGAAEFFWHGSSEPYADDIQGLIVVRSDRGVFRIHRDRAGGNCSIEGADGVPMDASYMDELLEGVRLREYRDVFTFNLDRLRRLAARSAASVPKLVKMARLLKRLSPSTDVGDAAALPVEPTVDVSGASEALDALQTLLQQQAEAVNAAPAEIDRPRIMQDRERLTRELKKVDASLADLQSKIEFASKEVDETQCAMMLHRARARHAVISRELAELADGPLAQAMTDINEASIERLELKIAECKQQLKQLTDERDELARQGKQLARDDRASRLVTQIESTLIHEKSAIKDAETIDRLKLKIEDLETRLEDERRAANEAVHAHSSSLTQDSNRITRLESLADRLREAERQQDLAEQRLTQAESAALGSGFAHMAQTSGAVHPEDSFALHEAEQRVLQLRDRVDTHGEPARLQDERRAAIEDLRYLHEQQLLPLQSLIMLGIAFVAGVVMVIYGVTQFKPYANWKLVGVGMLITGAVSLIKMMLDRDRSDVLDRARMRLTQIDDELAQLQGTESTDTSHWQKQLAEAEHQLAELRSRLSRVPVAEPERPVPRDLIPVDVARSQLQDAQRRHRELSQQWRDLLLEQGLHPTLTPALAREALAQRLVQHTPPSESQVAQLEMQLAACRAELDVRVDWQTIVSGRLRQLLKDLGLPSGGSLSEQFHTLRDAYNDFSERRQTRRQLAREIRKVRQKALQLRDTGRRQTVQRDQLASEVAKRKLQQQFQHESRAEQRRLLQEQRDLIEQDIDEIQHRFSVEHKTLIADLTDAELGSRLTEQQDKLANLREQYSKQTEQRGRLRALLEEDLDDLPVAPVVRFDWENVDQHLKQLRSRLRDSTRVVQSGATSPPTAAPPPRYLEDASHYLDQLAGGQFRALQLADEDHQLLVVDNTGSAISLDEVDPNHFANIYFSLWLARLDAYADRGIRLPVVLEDPLESTRQSRRGIVAQLLSQFAAKGHQLILVTAHPENAREFARLGVPIADFSTRETVSQYASTNQMHEV